MLGMVVFGSILPLHWSWEGVSRWPMLFYWRDMQLPDILQNVAAFAPIGVVYGASRGKLKMLGCVIFAIGVAVALQFVQLWLPDRTPRLSDALANAIGLIVGLVFASATHRLRRLPGAPLPIDVAILLLLLCYFVLILLVERGAGAVMDQWLLHAGNDSGASLQFALKLLVLGFVVRAMIEHHDVSVWLFLFLCAACLAASKSASIVWLSVAILAGGAAAQWMPRKMANIMAIQAILATLLWEGLTPWIAVSRNMNWIPLQSMLISSSLAGFVTLAWKLFCWSALARLLCFWPLRGRLIMFLVALPTAVVEFAQMFIASGFPDITDVLLAAGLGGLVVLVVQQSGDRMKQAMYE